MAGLHGQGRASVRTGDRVRVTAAWSSFVGMAGVVKQVQPHLMILLDGDRMPIRVGEREIAFDSDEVSLTGAE